MAPIHSIRLNLETGNFSGAGTDGDVYLGFCGREFSVDTSADDFERGSARGYVFGDGANVNNAADNDPRKQFLDTTMVDSFPVYIRFQPTSRTDRWNLGRAVVTVNDQLFPMWDTATLVNASNGIWLGTHAGLIVHIPPHSDVIERPSPEAS